MILPRVLDAAGSFGVQTLLTEVRSSNDCDSAFASIRAWCAQRLYVISETGGAINSIYAAVADQALRSHRPSITAGRPYVAAGGLISFVANAQKQFTRAVYFVDRILRRAKPARRATYRVRVRAQPPHGAGPLGITFSPDVAAQVTDWIE